MPSLLAMPSMFWSRTAKETRDRAAHGDATAKITAALNLPGKVHELQSMMIIVQGPNLDWLLEHYKD